MRLADYEWERRPTETGPCSWHFNSPTEVILPPSHMSSIAQFDFSVVSLLLAQMPFIIHRSLYYTTLHTSRYIVMQYTHRAKSIQSNPRKPFNTLEIKIYHNDLSVLISADEELLHKSAAVHCLTYWTTVTFVSWMSYLSFYLMCCYLKKKIALNSK